MSKAAVIDVSGVNWKLLREQADAISSLTDPECHIGEVERSAIEGVLNLIAHIQHEALAIFGAMEIYGTEEVPTRAINDP